MSEETESRKTVVIIKNGYRYEATEIPNRPNGSIRDILGKETVFNTQPNYNGMPYMALSKCRKLDHFEREAYERKLKAE